MLIKEIMIEEIPSGMLLEAKKLGLTFLEGNIIYIGAFIEDNLIGFVGLKIQKNSAILKSSFVKKEYRLQGVFNSLHKERLKIIEKMSIKKVTANCTLDSLQYHINRGAKIIKQYKSFAKIRYNFDFQDNLL